MTSKGSTGIEVILSTLEVKPFNLCGYGYIASFHFIIGICIIKNVTLVSRLWVGL